MSDIGLDLQKAFDEGYKKGMADARKKIKEGKWVTDKVYYAGNGKLSGFTAKCSECGFTYKTNYSDYCPGCGAKMKIDKWWRDNG